MPLRGPATLVIGMRRTGMSAGSRLPICPCTVKPVVVVRFRQFIATVHGPELISPVATSRRPMLSMSRPGPGTNTTWQMAPLLAQGRVGGVGVALGLGTMVAVAVAPGVVLGVGVGDGVLVRVLVGVRVAASVPVGVGDCG